MKLKYPIIFLITFLLSCATQKVDVLVIGGGASGTTAGIQSARLGANTLIVEEFDWLGGMLTSAGVSAIDGNNKLPSGLWGEFRDSLALRYGGIDKLKTGWVSNTLFEPSIGASILLNMVQNEPIAHVWFKSTFISAKKIKNGWNVLVFKNGEKRNIKTKVLIDATELGNVAKACGVKYDIGMESKLESGEDIAPDKANNIVQDLTYVAILKDYGKGADRTILKPEGYDPSPFYCSCKSANCIHPKEAKRLFICDSLITYGKLPNNKYMINWPIEGNDYYLNIIEMAQEQRVLSLQKAKQFTLNFVYYLQTELGFKNLGLADDEFPTSDKMPFIAYYRESRRIHGLVRFNINYITKPYDQPEKLYRTGIAVGDYPVDHHHTRYHEWEKLPDLHFYSIPSYCLPLGVMLPHSVKGLIVAEKSISVSNLANGTTRLQPVVLQIGQAAGVVAALSIRNHIDVSQISVRNVQNALLKAKGYIMPYLDVPPTDPLFLPFQRIGATGILKGVGKNVAWSNQTWFRADDPMIENELQGLSDIYPSLSIVLSDEKITLQKAIKLIETIAKSEKIILPQDAVLKILTKFGITNLDPKRVIKRKEMAILIDQLLDPFNRKPVNIKGEFIHQNKPL